ncbi:polysaccharide biosynthesis/transport protein [Lysinibacillus sphaericus]|nr:polysaccharide biosynthesis protein [Lysinibacillus sphaericus]KEK12013.1 polysaccharide biosynthesis/transport protein [Lysinibacillus sphaericus]
MSQSTFVKSTLVLTIATLLSKVIGSIFRIPLQNIAGDEVLGIFSLVYPVYMVALYLSVAGIPIAISKLIAEANSSKDTAKIKKIYVTARILALSFGVISFTIIYGFSAQIANALGGPSTEIALIIVALTLLVAPYMAVYRGFFQGFGDMRPTAISQVIEQLVRVALILIVAYFLVAMDYSNDIVAGGIMAGSVLGALGSLVYLLYKYFRSSIKVTSKEKYSSKDFSTYSKTILKISIPIAIGSVTMALFNFVDSFTVTYGLRNAGADASEISFLYGIYGRGLTLVQITTVFASSIILPLVPLITTKIAERKMDETRSIIERTHRMTHLISWPAAIGLLALTLPLNLALFKDLEGSLMLAMINLSSVFTSLTLLGTGVLQGMNAAKTGALIILSGVVLKVFANIFFIQAFGLDGAAYATLLVYFVLFIVNTVFIYRMIRFTVLGKDTVKMIVSSIVMGAAVGLPTLWLDFTHGSRMWAMGYLTIAIIVGGAIYFLLLWVMKAIHKQDLKKIPVIGKRFS